MKFIRKPVTNEVNAIQFPMEAKITVKGKCADVAKNDWLVIDEEGCIRVYSDEIFQKKFEPVSKDAI